MSITNREIIGALVPSKYDDQPERKKRIVNLFFSNIITNDEFDEVKATINEVSDKFRSKIGDTKGFNLGNRESRMRYLMSLNKKQLEEYEVFNEHIRKVFDFKIGKEESNLHFRMGPQSSYFYIELDHYIVDERVKKKVTYNDNRKMKKKLSGRPPEWEYTPTVYINHKHRLFRNVLNYLKEINLLDDFIFGFEEKVLEVI